MLGVGVGVADVAEVGAVGDDVAEVGVGAVEDIVVDYRRDGLGATLAA